MLQLIQHRRLALEDHVDVEAGAVLFVGNPGKVLLVHLLHGFHLPAQRFYFGRDLAGQVVDPFFFARRFEYK